MTATGLERICTRRGPALLAAVALAGALAAPAQAEVVTFTGESLVDATNWHVSTNWRNQNGSHVVPTSADDAVIPSGRTATLGTGDGAAQSVVLDTNAHLDVDGQTLSVGTNAPGCSVFVESGDEPHEARNLTDHAATVYATFIAPHADPGVFRIEDPLINCP